MDDLEVREEFGEGNEHQSDHRVVIFKMNLKPATIYIIRNITITIKLISLLYHFHEKYQLEGWTIW